MEREQGPGVTLEPSQNSKPLELSSAEQPAQHGEPRRVKWDELEEWRAREAGRTEAPPDGGASAV